MVFERGHRSVPMRIGYASAAERPLDLRLDAL